MDLLSVVRGRSVVSRATRLIGFLGIVAALEQILGAAQWSLVQWLGLPLLTSLSANIFLVSEVLLFPARKSPTPRTPTNKQTNFAKSLIEYVAFLQQQGKMNTILHIRESLSHLLHLLGENKTRYELGERALAAAIETESTLDRAQILIDDLGWAAHLLNQGRTAETNIKRGIDVANSIQTNNVADFVSSRLTAAKGYRHLAMMAKDESAALTLLTKAEEVILSLNDKADLLDIFHDDITRDRAQIEHARATLIARSLGISEAGTVAASDRQAIERASEALGVVNKASTAFESIGDYERLNKALFLVERLNSALDHETAALETRAKREKIARSLSVRKQ